MGTKRLLSLSLPNIRVNTHEPNRTEHSLTFNASIRKNSAIHWIQWARCRASGYNSGQHSILNEYTRQFIHSSLKHCKGTKSDVVWCNDGKMVFGAMAEKKKWTTWYVKCKKWPPVPKPPLPSPPHHSQTNNKPLNWKQKISLLRMNITCVVPSAVRILVAYTLRDSL